MAPAMEIARVIPAWAPCIVAAARAAPVPFFKAHKILMVTIPVQIQLITILFPSYSVQYA
jgi:hypothetical protein